MGIGDPRWDISMPNGWNISQQVGMRIPQQKFGVMEHYGKLDSVSDHGVQKKEVKSMFKSCP
jgi:hypothetical protein